MIMKKKILWICLVLVVAGTAAIGGVILGNKPVSVETAKVTRGNIEEYIEETGNLLLEEETEIYSASSGKITEVTKKAGEAVKAGEVLARIDNSDLRLQIKVLEAQRLAILAKYQDAKSAVDEEEINRLSAQLRFAEISYEEAKETADKNKVLYEAGAISMDTYKGSITALASAEANYETAKSSLALAEKEISENVKKQYEAQLSELQATIDQLELKSQDMIVKSPIDGMVMAVEVKEGNIVQTGTKLFDIGGSNGFYIESKILIEDIAGVKIGSKVIIDDEDLGIKELKGTVRKIYPKAVSVMSDLGIEQKRVKVEIDLDNPAEGLRPGYDMTIKIITQSKKDTLLVDEKAIFSYKGKDHVFVNENGVTRLRAIERGLESDSLVEILSGLEEGEDVILSPDETMEEGMKIKQ
jgi:HlyD family secretion protein